MAGDAKPSEPPRADTWEDDALEAHLWREMIEYLVNQGEPLADAMETAALALPRVARSRHRLRSV